MPSDSRLGEQKKEGQADKSHINQGQTDTPNQCSSSAPGSVPKGGQEEDSPQSDCCKQKCGKTGRDALDWLTFGISVLTLIAVGVYAWFAHDQAVASAKAAREAIISNGQSREQFRLAQQPWVSVKAIAKTGEFVAHEEGTPRPQGETVGKIVVQFINTGLTPAMATEIAAFTKAVKKGSSPTFTYVVADGNDTTSRGVVAPNQIAALSPLAVLEYKGAFSQDAANVQYDGVVYGFSRYKDRAGKFHCMLFCFYGRPMFGKTSFSACEQHNDIYEETEQRQCPKSIKGSPAR